MAGIMGFVSVMFAAAVAATIGVYHNVSIKKELPNIAFPITAICWGAWMFGILAFINGLVG